MRLPWSDWIDRKVERALASAAPRIKEEARAELVRETASEMHRAMAGETLPGYATVPGGYPQTGGSPNPLYGYDRPIWYATPNSPKRRPDSLVDIDTLRRFAKTYDVMRSCINHLKREVYAQPFVIGPRDDDDDSEATRERVRQALDFFSRRGGLGEANETRRHYESKIFEDVLVVGAFASWKNLTRGNRLVQVLPIDAATIRPRMDAYGWPGPGEDWYEQWIMGMKVASFAPDELVYDGLWPMTDSPYFASPVEYLVATVLSALKADEWNRTWLTDGNTPDRMIFTPPEWTPTQIMEYAEYFNAKLAGDTRARQQAQFVPGGLKGEGGNSRKDQDFQEFELWLLRRTCAMFGVQPASVGFAGEQYKVSQSESMDSTTQFGAGALITLRKEHYDDLLENLGFGDLEVKDGKSAKETPLEKAQRIVLLTGGPVMQINEGRAEIGQQPIEGGDVVLVSNTVQPLERAIAEPEETEPDDPTDAADADIERWQRKALKRVKSGKAAACDFESAHIPPRDREAIRAALSTCKTADDVRRVFGATP